MTSNEYTCAICGIVQATHVAAGEVRRTLCVLCKIYDVRMGDQSWRDDAACRNTDPESFFPERVGSQPTKAARRLCASCPVADDCFEYALATRSTGLWAGVTIYQALSQDDSVLRQARAAFVASHGQVAA